MAENALAPRILLSVENGLCSKNARWLLRPEERKEYMFNQYARYTCFTSTVYPALTRRTKNRTGTGPDNKMRRPETVIVGTNDQGVLRRCPASNSPILQRVLSRADC